MKKVFEGLGLIVGGLLLLAVLVVGGQVFRFSRAAATLYDVPAVQVVSTSDSAVLARGAHLAESIGGCTACHGEDLSGQLVDDFGPMGVFYAPNLTSGEGGVTGDYADGELARVVRHGINREGRSLLFMPSGEWTWWPDSDLEALVSHLRQLPPVDNVVPLSEVGLLGKVLDRFGVLSMLAAEGIDHDAPPAAAPQPAPTAEYGQYLAMACQGCHGEGLSGGPIPGAPADLPSPANLTPHESGLATWSESDFFRLLESGFRPDGSEVDPFMGTQATRNMNETEKSALWAYLRTLPPTELGNR